MTEEIKKTTVRTRKPSTKTAEVVENKEIKQVVEEVAEERVLKDSDKILVMNNTTGQYGYQGTNGYAFDLSEYGQTIKIPLSELRVMASGKARAHLTKAWIVILDEDVVEELNLINDYKYIYKENQIKELLKDPELISEVLQKMPGAMQTTVVTTAKRMVKSGELTNLRVVQAFKEVANVDIME